MNVLDKLSRIETLRPKDGDILFVYLKPGNYTQEDYAELHEGFCAELEKSTDAKVNVILCPSLEKIQLLRKEE